ncbi:pyruvate kinase [Oscillatoria sp. CS-180]|uniref:pyruvate kinase n=1 Tax=Oscillatoria sp. CS-180 TaxID=3021720 RepID=UPI00233038E9|nr:pyruvate kinase [Oscillatoria sp. CS-180]MDB9526018.1 pyruvate kinase [Oscillatoria sp. CS-180]
MKPLSHRTKIVATIGPASHSRETILEMVRAGMNVARLNFSHGTYEAHSHTIHMLRAVSEELRTPITLLQDLQGPKIRVGQLLDGAVELKDGETITLVPMDEAEKHPDVISIDYPYLADEAETGMQVLMDDGLLELMVESVEPSKVVCRIIQGGLLKSRKGVNLPDLSLRLPSMTDKDKEDLAFGVSQGVDWVSLSFVRRGEDILALKAFLSQAGAPETPVIAKIEKPQAIANLDAILDATDGVMVARGDLGVEMKAEKVPLLQKRIIRACNLRSIPVITATQMLESMIEHPRPTRAEASDVANAIIDGTDAVMLSGESAVGKFPVRAVQMLSRIAIDVEADLSFVNNPPASNDLTHAISEALNVIDKVLNLQCIVAYTESGYSAIIAAGERPNVPVVAFTPDRDVYHRLNLVWGVKPILIKEFATTFEEMTKLAETSLLEADIASPGDQVLIMGGIPANHPKGTNFLKIQTIGME